MQHIEETTNVPTANSVETLHGSKRRHVPRQQKKRLTGRFSTQMDNAMSPIKVTLHRHENSQNWKHHWNGQKRDQNGARCETCVVLL